MARIRVTDSGPTRIKLKVDDWAASIANRADELIYRASDVDDTDIQLYCFDKKNMLVKIEQDPVVPQFRRMTFVEILG